MNKLVIESIVKLVAGMVGLVLGSTIVPNEMFATAGLALMATGLIELPFRA